MKKILKHSKNDFDVSTLPVTRGKQLIDIYKNRFPLLLLLGLCLAIFTLPILISIPMKDMALVALAENDTKSIIFTYFIFQISLIIYLLINSICISGITNIIRNLYYSESVVFFSDFAKGIKQNFLNNFLASLIFGIIYLVSFFVIMITNFNALGLIPMIICILLFFPSYIWVILENSIYKDKLSVLIKNSVFFISKNIWKTYSLCVAMLLPLSLTFISDFLIKDIIVFLYACFALPFIAMLFFVIALNSFDKYINVANYKDHYKKGLYDPKKDIL